MGFWDKNACIGIVEYISTEDALWTEVCSLKQSLKLAWSLKVRSHRVFS